MAKDEIKITENNNTYKDVNNENLDSPLVVHKESDYSYRPAGEESAASSTYTETELDEATLERHRYKRQKKSKAPYVILILAVIAAAVFAGLYFTNTLPFMQRETTAPTTTRKSYTTSQANKFAGVITVKGTYIFYEGTEVDGIEGLTREIKYVDEGTKFIIQDENADSKFLNFEVLQLLTEAKMKYEITHIVSSGLKSKYETTTSAVTTTKKDERTTTKKTSSNTTENTTAKSE